MLELLGISATVSPELSAQPLTVIPVSSPAVSIAGDG